MPDKAFEIDKQRHETLVYNNKTDEFRVEIGAYRAETDDNRVTVHFCLVHTHFLTVRIHFGTVRTRLVAVLIDFYSPFDCLTVLRMKFLQCIRPYNGGMRCKIINGFFLHLQRLDLCICCGQC